MNPRVLKRFIIICLVATFIIYTGSIFFKEYFGAVPGDFETRQGDILLSDKKYDEAISSFNRALEKAPNHRGALMGRALVLCSWKNTKKQRLNLHTLSNF
jgi:hypothetical protein